MRGVSEWNRNIVQIRDSIKQLRAEIGSYEPRDRLDAVSKVTECLNFMRQTNTGWLSFLGNATLVNGLDEESLKDIFSRFRRMTMERIDNDVDCIDRYMLNLVPRSDAPAGEQ
jgi:hypothetical protein